VIPQVDVCQALYDRSGEGSLTELADALMRQQPQADGKMGNCQKHAVFKKFCAAVETPRGFADLDADEIYAREQAAQNGAPKISDAQTAAASAEFFRVRNAPLTESMKACGLGSDTAAMARLQAKLLPVAEKENRWGFMLHYASDTYYPQLLATAKAECSGRSFTNAANSTYLGLCRSYGSALVRGDRAGVLAAAGCTKERENPARGICIGAGAGKGSSGAAQFADEPRSGGSADPQGDAASDEKKSKKDKAKDALDKGKKALRGLLGG
jgi:hypothetical protein